MKSKSIFRVGVLALLSLGIFLYINSRNSSPKSKEFPWADIRKDALIQIDTESFLDGAAEKYSLNRSEGEWVLTKPDFYDTLPEKTSILANVFMNLKPKELLTNISTEEYNAYGFNSPRVKITAKIKGRKDVVLLLGSETSVGEDVYLTLEELSSSAYIVPAAEIQIFLKGMNSLINNKILKENGDTVNALSFRNMQNENMNFVKKDGFWIEQPSMATNKDWGLRKLILSIQDLVFETEKIVYRVPLDKAGEFGIDTDTSPFLSLSFTNGKTSTLYIGSTNDNFYNIYIPEMKIAALMQKGIAHGVFTTLSQDLSIKKK